MSRNIFGWSYPPGAANDPNAPWNQTDEGPCAVCGNGVEDCCCPECHVCGEQGNPKCYKPLKCEEHWEGPYGHGLKLNREQALSRQRTVIRVAQERVCDEEMAYDAMKNGNVKEWDLDDLPDPWA
jgi:hypothetical protein